VFLNVFNDSASTAFNDGDVVFITGVKTASTELPQAKTPATASVAVRIGVVANGQLTKSGIAAKSYGYVQIAGYCTKVAVPGSTAAERYLAATNGTLVATDVAAANTNGITGLTAACFAITKTAESGGFAEAYIFQSLVTV